MLLLAACAMLAAASPATAWGDRGHEIVADIAYRHLTPAARAKVDALLAADADSLTAPDFASRATWADKYRNTHRETAAWHYVNIEIDRPDLDSACFGFPQLPSAEIASAGPAQDCIVNKITEFEAEFKDPGTVPAERLLALKFLLHFVGDIHQPLHAADHQDRGGNCIALAPPPDGQANLHAYWDVAVVDALGGGSAEAVASILDARISANDLSAWSQGDARTWVMESFELARKDAYALASRPTCADTGAIALSDAYQTAAAQDAALQLSKAGVRLAAVLNRALGS